MGSLEHLKPYPAGLTTKVSTNGIHPPFPGIGMDLGKFGSASITVPRQSGKTYATNLSTSIKGVINDVKFDPEALDLMMGTKKADTSEPVQRKLDGVYHRTLWYVPRLDPDYLINQPTFEGDDIEDVKYPSEEEGTPEERKKVSVPEKANALSSLARSIVPGDEGGEEVHLPCIDIDYPISFERGVLGIEKPMSDDEAEILLDAFKEAKLIHQLDARVEKEGAEFLFGPFACRVLCRPSSTSGHFHLYIDAPLTWDTYEDLLVRLGEEDGGGLVEEGYVRASVRRKQTFVRIRKNKRECEQATTVQPDEPDEVF